MKLSGSPERVIVVTGGSRGIGAATVLALANNGRDVAPYQKTLERPSPLSAQRLSTVGAVWRFTDVTLEVDVRRVCASAGELGAVTGLVDNAGLTGHVGDVDTPVELIRRVIDVNFLGVVVCARMASQVLSSRRGALGGAIVSVSSRAATLGSAHEYVHYAAAKAAVDAFTIGLPRNSPATGSESTRSRRGMVETDIHAAAGDPDRAERAAARIPMGRAAEPGEIAPGDRLAAEPWRG